MSNDDLIDVRVNFIAFRQLVHDEAKAACREILKELFAQSVGDIHESIAPVMVAPVKRGPGRPRTNPILRNVGPVTPVIAKPKAKPPVKAKPQAESGDWKAEIGAILSQHPGGVSGAELRKSLGWSKATYSYRMTAANAAGLFKMKGEKAAARYFPNEKAIAKHATNGAAEHQASVN
jgi:hypothetical protein